MQKLSVDAQRANLLATRYEFNSTNVGPGPILLFNSHLDTVPPYIAPIVDVDADGNKVLKGRGACDAKGQIAAMVFAAEKLVRERPELTNEIGLLFVSDEEYTHYGMKVEVFIDDQVGFYIVIIKVPLFTGG